MGWANAVISHPQFELRESDYLRWYPKTLTGTTGAAPTSAAWGRVQGAYIHVPFCDEICKFCPFHKMVTTEEAVSKFVEGLRAEILLVAESVVRSPLQFVYFGGGTPSVLSSTQLQSIIDELARSLGIAEDAEVSIEAHPTHASRERLSEYRMAGVNRVSFGLQSFSAEHLLQLGATHSQEQSFGAVEAGLSAIGNVAVDLLYRYPAQSPSEWDRELKTALDLGVEHLSCYSLVEVGAAKANRPSAESDVELAVRAMEFCEERGLVHYASCASGGFDLAVPGREGRYELHHWRAPQSDFVGLGPSAIGFVGAATTVNVLNLKTYLSRVQSGRHPLLSMTPANLDEQMRRYFALGVKTVSVPLASFRTKFSVEPRKYFHREFAQLESWGFARIGEDSVDLTQVGRLYVDTCSALFYSKSERDVPHPEEPEFRALERRLELAV